MTNQTTEKLALAFCREILGWKKAKITKLSNIWNGKDCERSEGLSPRDLNAVTDAAQKWCDRNDVILETSYYKGNTAARARFSERLMDDAWEHDMTACEAIMHACIAASRKLKD